MSVAYLHCLESAELGCGNRRNLQHDEPYATTAAAAAATWDTVRERISYAALYSLQTSPPLLKPIEASASSLKNHWSSLLAIA